VVVVVVEIKLAIQLLLVIQVDLVVVVLLLVEYHQQGALVVQGQPVRGMQEVVAGKTLAIPQAEAAVAVQGLLALMA
jgi:hypothetical protein